MKRKNKREMLVFVNPNEMANIIYTRTKRLQKEIDSFIDLLCDIDFKGECDNEKLEKIEKMFDKSEELVTRSNNINYATKDLFNESKEINLNYNKAIDESEENSQTDDTLP